MPSSAPVRSTLQPRRACTAAWSCGRTCRGPGRLRTSDPRRGRPVDRLGGAGPGGAPPSRVCRASVSDWQAARRHPGAPGNGSFVPAGNRAPKENVGQRTRRWLWRQVTSLCAEARGGPSAKPPAGPRPPGPRGPRWLQAQRGRQRPHSLGAPGSRPEADGAPRALQRVRVHCAAGAGSRDRPGARRPALPVGGSASDTREEHGRSPPRA